MKKIFCVLIIVVLAASCCLCFAACDASPTLDRDYYFSVASGTSVLDLTIVTAALDTQSGLVLTKDGKFILTLKLSEGINSLLKLFNVDLGGVSELDIAPEAAKYADPILPWFDMTDMRGSLEKLRQSLGAELILDYEEEATKKMLDALETTGRLNPDFEIPKTLGLRYEGTYKIKHLKSEITGEEYTALFVDKYSEGGEPFFIATLTENEGKKRVSGRVEFLMSSLVFEEITETE